MHHTEPTVFMIGKTQAIRENIRAWLDFIGAEEFEVPSPNVGSDCSLLVTLAGKRCFDEDTEILTSDGWKLFKDLDKTEEVMTLNPHTGRCEWQSPKDYIEYQHDGSMLFAESRDVSFAVTPDHRQFGWMGHAGRSSERVKNLPDFVDTSDIECREFRILSAPVNIRNIANWEAWIGRVVSKINLRSPVTVQNKSNQFGSYGIRDYSSDDYEFNTESQVIAFAKLCIYYATEGCQLHKSESYGGVAIYGSSHIDEIINICSILGLKYNITEDKRNNVKRIVIGGGSAISYYLSENCGSGSNNKCLPRWVLDLPVECLKELWNIFVETDGHRYDNGAEVLITTSEKLAGNVQEILCKLGFSSSCLEDSEGVNFKVWRVRKKQGQPIVLNRRSSSSVFSDLYNGKVYCVSTDNGIVLVRRYGKVHFSGNCYMSFQPGLNPNVTRVRTDMTEFIDNILKVAHGCYDIETEVLTSDGWKKWIDVDMDTRFATRTSDGIIEYKKPIKLVQYKHDGKMYRVKGRGIDLLVTPDHKMLACKMTTREGRRKEKFELIQASELGDVNHCYIKSARWDHCSVIDIPKNILWLLGFSIGDGNYNNKKGVLRFHMLRQRKIDALLERFNSKVEKHNNNQYYYYVPNEYREFFFDIYNNNGEKVIPQRLLVKLCYADLMEIYKGLLESDGSIYGQNFCETYDTTSEELAGQIQQLMLHLGKASNISQADCYKKRKHSFGNKPIFRNNIITRELCPEVNRPSHSNDYKKKTSWIDFSGDVYCAEVPNNTLYVRRNGQPVWSGNSVLEHCVYTFAIENISRVFTGELNRHRAGMAISEGSMRYIRYEDIPYWVPFSIRENEDDTPEIASKKGETREVMDRAFQEMENNYSELVNLWKKELSPGSSFKIKKHLTSMFRRMVGMGVSTGGVWSGNLRALRHVFTMRCSEAAEEEILHVASMLLEMMIESEPNFFKDFEKVGGYWKPKYMKV